MTKLKKALFGVIVLFIVTALPLAHAQNAPEHSGQRIQEIYRQLNLTDDQKKQLEANKSEHRAKMESARQEMKTDKEALQEALMSPQLDLHRVHELHDRIKALQSKMEDIKLSSILAVRTILTSEQFTKFVNLMHKHKQDHD